MAVTCSVYAHVPKSTHTALTLAQAIHEVPAAQPKYLLPMIERQAATGCDVVTGTRYHAQGGVFGWDLKRKVTSRGANLLAQLLLQPNVTDLTGSFRLYKRQAFENIIHQVHSKVRMSVRVQNRHWGRSIDDTPPRAHS